MCCSFCCIWRGHILNSVFCSGCFRAMVQLFYDITKVLHDGFSVGSMINCWDWPYEGSRPPACRNVVLQMRMKVLSYRLTLNAKITHGVLSQCSTSSSYYQWSERGIMGNWNEDFSLGLAPMDMCFCFTAHDMDHIISIWIWFKPNTSLTHAYGIGFGLTCFHGNTLAREPWQIDLNIHVLCS